MKNFTIKTRLLGLVAALLLLLILSAYANIYRLGVSNAVLGSVYNDRVVPLKQLKEVADGYFIGLVDTAHKTRDGLMKPEDGLRALAQARIAIDKNWKAYLATELIDEEKALVVKTEQAMKVADAAAQHLHALLSKNDIEGLRAFTAREMYPAVDPLGEDLHKLTEVQLQVAEQVYQHAEADYGAVLWRNIAISAVVVVAAALFAWMLVGAIAGGIAQAVKVAETVAAGDLSSRIEVTSQDETGQLLAALQAHERQPGRHRRPGAQRLRLDRHRLGADRHRQRRPEPAHRRAGQQPAADGGVDGAADRHRQEQRRHRAPGHPAGQQRLRPRPRRAARWWARWSAPWRTSAPARRRSPTSSA